MALVIKPRITPSGVRVSSVSTIEDLSFADLQTFVEGYVEYVGTRDGRVLAVNEEGCLRCLPVNDEASELAGRTIVGNVVVLTQEEVPA